MNLPEILRFGLLCIAWGFLQASVALAIPPLYAKLTRTYGIISLEPGFLIALIGGAVLAVVINPWFLIGVVLGVPWFGILLRLFSNKPQ